ncbi:MAG: pilus assembly protein N-terminal domain-containing protein [Halopseudomonas aestusnigri]
MQHTPTLGRFLTSIVLSLLFLTLLLTTTAESDELSAETTLEQGSGEVFFLPTTVQTVIVVDQSIAEAKTPAPGRLFIFGKKVGVTEIYAIDFEGNVVFKRHISVKHQATALAKTLQNRFPNNPVTVSSSKGSLMVTGTADTPKDAEDILETITPFAKDDKIITRLGVRSARRVRLYVRLLEIQRNIDESFGVDWNAILATGSVALSIFQGGVPALPAALAAAGSTRGGGIGGSYNSSNVDINLAVDFLEQRGYASILSEPNLTTMSGEAASFSVGQDVPLPTFTSAAADNVSTGNFGITYKFFGLGLNFTPTVQSRDTVSLDIDISSSEATNSSIVINGTSLPVFNSEEFKTVIELKTGQTFAIAGLMKKVGRDSVDQVPGLGTLPVLGKLFASTNYQQSQSDLVVLVTPYFTDDAPKETEESPSVNRPLSNVEYILLTRNTGTPPIVAPPGAPRMPSAVGFTY